MKFKFIEKLEVTTFSWKRWEIYPFLIVFLIIHFAWSKHFPIADVEAYYWDWSRYLSLSYYDHPGAIAWICRLGTIITQNENNLRFFVPIFSLITSIFLILSLNIILSFQNKQANLKQVLYLEIIYNIIPVFSIQSFILMPDFSLLTFLSISFFISLKIIKYFDLNKKDSLILIFILGISGGMGFNSKYHMLPIIFLLVLTILIVNKRNLKNIFIFLSIFIFSFILTAMPTLYWNIKNHYASFLFQLNHGFGSFSFRLDNPISYIIESSLYISPVLFGYGVYKIILLKKFHSIKEIEPKLIFLAILPVTGLFLIFLLASFYNYVAPYWISPAFLLLIPFITIDLTNWKFNKIFIPLFFFISLTIPTVLCFKESRKFITDISHGNIGYKLLFWYIFTDTRIEKELGIELPKSITPEELAKNGCSKNDTILASLNWTWTSQLAYHLKGHPYIYNINQNQKSFYSFRDKLSQLKKCKVIIISSEELAQDILQQMEDIKVIKLVEIKSFPRLEYSKINIIRGTYKGSDLKNKISMSDD
ncbi:ArnT family glycosyltransferase [Silvanigrella aquatica]|uniref:Glycosyltransferase RgtA/B/C/D-like domain-containing protein n=1 Tax=Silvanigrella aquatica TaxID=1915309 RepID=A0A1L4D323_9BACT|nr:glycosyltransferase family 39 protein [Silvanigrella aquatica]APJ04608.1 hypothetical protein AXG55_12110 [Silvanigrella aquatica]